MKHLKIYELFDTDYTCLFLHQIGRVDKTIKISENEKDELLKLDLIFWKDYSVGKRLYYDKKDLKRIKDILSFMRTPEYKDAKKYNL